MAAIVNGTVFNDLNHNGTYNSSSESGIKNVYVVLYTPNNSCIQTQTTSLGYYEFLNITLAGSYIIYETVTTPNSCPPTNFSQPDGFNGSTTRRKISLTITTTQINNNTTIGSNNFGHDYTTVFGCNPFAWQYANGDLIRIDLALGNYMNLGSSTPSSSNLNGVGYNVTDGNMYGWNGTSNSLFRGSKDRILVNLPAVPNLPIVSYNCGDIDRNGYLYLYRTTETKIYVIDVNPNRATYCLLVNPQNNFNEQISSPYGLSITAVTASDFAINPINHYIYVIDNSGNCKKIDPITGTTTSLIVSPVIAEAYGGQFFDNYNHIYSLGNTSGKVLQYTINGNNLSVIDFSTSLKSNSNDGMRCASSPIYFAIFDDPIIKTATPRVGVNDVINYTLILNNIGNSTAKNVTLIDTIPTETTFISNSIYVDGVLNTGNPSPPFGVNLGNMSIGYHTVTFNVLVNTVPINGIVKNTGSITFKYTDTIGNLEYTDSAQTTTAITTISNAILHLTKSVNKGYIDLGEILTYTFQIENTGNYVTKNIFFKDTIPVGTTFVLNSLKQDSTIISGNPNSFVTLPNQLYPGDKSYITFNVIVNTTIPSESLILNNSTLIFEYIGNPTIQSIKSGNANSNTVTTTLNTAEIIYTKNVDKDYVKLNSILDYTLTIKNIGTTTITSLYIIDTLPDGITFVEDSIFINGVQKPSEHLTPPLGLNITNISANTTITITFNGVATKIPSINPALNEAFASFSYNLDESTQKTKIATTNTVATTINEAILEITKAADRNNAFLDNTAKYTLVIKNTGNVVSTNIIFVDTIPIGTEFVSGSFFENGVNRPSVDLSLGSISLSNINPNGTTTLEFKVLITTIPSQNPILNKGFLNYSYTINPITILNNTKSIESNLVSILVNPESNPLKIVDKNFSTIGDEIVYTVRWINNLLGEALNVRLIDTIPTETSFVPNSIYLNGVNLLNKTVSPPSGLLIGTVPMSSISTVTFKVLVQTLPTINPIINDATVTFDFVIDTITQAKEHRSSNSNEVWTKINMASLNNNTKVVDLNYATLNDILTYTVSFNSIGNKGILNFRFIDTIPNGLDFIEDTLTFNGNINLGKNPNPPLGFYLESIPSNEAFTISFKAKVTTLPTPNPILNSSSIFGEYILDESTDEKIPLSNFSNTTVTTISYGEATLSKMESKKYAELLDTIIYTLYFKNTGNENLKNVYLTDALQSECTFISGSLFINNINYPSYTPETIPIGQVLIGESITITFNTVVQSIPDSNFIKNTGKLYYEYNIGTSSSDVIEKISNNVVTTINYVNLNTSKKYVDKNLSTCNEVITYTFVINNTGNALAKNVILIDTISNNLDFISNSIEINGVPIYNTNPKDGIPIGILQGYSTKTVTFKCKVNCV